jgi:hypothetical protein
MPHLNDDVVLQILDALFSLLPDRNQHEHLYEGCFPRVVNSWEGTTRLDVLYVCRQWRRVALTHSKLLYPTPFIADADYGMVRLIYGAIPRPELTVLAMDLYKDYGGRYFTRLLRYLLAIDRTLRPHRISLHGEGEHLYSFIHCIMKHHWQDIRSLSLINHPPVHMIDGPQSAVGLTAVVDHPSILTSLTSLTLVLEPHSNIGNLHTCMTIFRQCLQVQSLTLGGCPFVHHGLYVIAVYNNTDLGAPSWPHLHTEDSKERFARQFLLPQLEDLKIVYGSRRALELQLRECLDSDPHSHNAPIYGVDPHHQSNQELKALLPQRLVHPELGLYCSINHMLNAIIARYQDLRKQKLNSLTLFEHRAQVNRIWLQDGMEKTFNPLHVSQLRNLAFDKVQNIVGRCYTSFWEIEV